ncbi:uncharacterized protein [Coffea arabica]|uniref:Uncharacterized protein n=1 Tax=Coffea arabica TaxID=13443 RepID=A0ABM4X7C6_COFAR
MRWLVYAGTCDFWYDNWLGTRALFHRAPVNALTFRDFLKDKRWDSLLLAQYFPSDVTALILRHPTPKGERPDEVVWMPTTFGHFFLSSAFQEVRQARNASWLFSCIWHPQIPLKVSFFMLRLLMRRLLLDDILETTCGFYSPKFYMLAYLEGEEYSGMGRAPAVVWGDLSCHPSGHLRGGRELVRWQAAGRGLVLLNTDGCSKGNPGASGGGGVLRDSNGQVLVGYSAYLGVNTSLRADALALLPGLRLCVQKGYTQVRVQSDSLVLVGILQWRFQCSWHIRREVTQIWLIADDPGLFSHSFREAKKVADILANVGILHPHDPVKVYDQSDIFPQLARGEVRMQKLGFPSLRYVKGLSL